MKIYRHRYRTPDSPTLTIQHPDETSTKAKHGQGAALTYVQKLAEHGEAGQGWRILEYDTLLATVTRSADGTIRTGTL